MRDLLVNEVYGPVFQGEGRQRGQLAVFVRLGTCNLHCSWCDTPYTWIFDDRHAAMHVSGKKYDPEEELIRMSPSEVALKVSGLGHVPPHTLIIFSGGEPLLQPEGIIETVKELIHHGFYNFAIETAGTKSPPKISYTNPLLDVVIDAKVHYTVSPKLANSYNAKSLRYHPDILREFVAIGADFKFVVQWPSDLVEIQDIAYEASITPEHIWIMPEGVMPEEILKKAQRLEPFVLSRGWNFTLRDHVLIHGNERGF